MFGTNTEPISLSADDRTKANNIYDHWGQSLSFLERSADVSPFTSKFDAYLAGNYKMTAAEMAGYKLFDGKGNCNSCHLDGRSTAPTPPPPKERLRTAWIRRDRSYHARVHLLGLCQSRPSQESEGCSLMRDDTG